MFKTITHYLILLLVSLQFFNCSSHENSFPSPTPHPLLEGTLTDFLIFSVGQHRGDFFIGSGFGNTTNRKGDASRFCRDEIDNIPNASSVTNAYDKSQALFLGGVGEGAVDSFYDQTIDIRGLDDGTEYDDLANRFSAVFTGDRADYSMAAALMTRTIGVLDGLQVRESGCSGTSPCAGDPDEYVTLAHYLSVTNSADTSVFTATGGQIANLQFAVGTNNWWQYGNGTASASSTPPYHFSSTPAYGCGGIHLGNPVTIGSIGNASSVISSENITCNDQHHVLCIVPKK